MSKKILIAAWSLLSPTTQRAYAGRLQAFSHSKNWSTFLAYAKAGPMETNEAIAKHMAPYRAKAPGTFNLTLSALKWPFLALYRAGKIDWQVRVRGVRITPTRDMSGPGMSEALEMAAIADAEPGVLGLRDGVLIRLLLVLGLRRNEISSLNIEHFDGARLRIKGKGRKEREWIAVPETLAKRIKKYLAFRQDYEVLPTDPLLISCDRARKGDGRLTDSGIYRRVRFLAAKSGIGRRMSPCRIRHTAITTKLDSESIWRARKFARHVRADSTLGYDDKAARRTKPVDSPRTLVMTRSVIFG